jgi:hypothetical protein
MREDLFYQEIKEALLKTGWQDEDLLFESVMYTHGRIYHTDIVLLYNLYPLAVVEIKRNLDTLASVSLDTREKAEVLGIPFTLVTDKTRTWMITTLTGESQAFLDFPTPKDLWTALGREWNLNDPCLYPPFRQEHGTVNLPQALAISRVLDAVMSGKRRIFLAMENGTGRSWVLFQIAWKLIQSTHCRRMLYLTDRVMLLEQIRERFRSLDQNLLVLSRTRMANDSARVHMATVSQLRMSETSSSLLSLTSDFYDLIFLESARFEKSPILDHFSLATHLAFDAAESSKIPPEYGAPVFTHTVHDDFEIEYAHPPDGFVAIRLSEIADIQIGRRHKDKTYEINNTTTHPGCYLITPKNLKADGTFQFDANNAITMGDIDEQLVLQSDDILLVRFTTGVQNRVALVSGNLRGKMIFDDSLIRIRVDRQSADTQAVFAFLRSDSGQRMLRTMAFGSVVSRLSVREVANMQVFLPKHVGIVNEVTELSAAMRALHEIRTRVIPLLEIAEQEHEENTAIIESSPNLYVAAERLRNLASTLVPPSLVDRVINEYPTPIAQACRRFQDARFDIYQQLFRLRDLFEAATYFIYHVVLADMLLNLNKQQYFIEDRGARRAYNGYSMAARIDFVSSVLQVARRNDGQDLFIPELVDLISVLDLVRHLQDNFRNPLSHTTTANESIAEMKLKTFKPDVDQLLEQLAFLIGYPLVRISSFIVRQRKWMRRMVVYKGVVPFYDEESLSTTSIVPSAESDHLVLLGDKDNILDLYPFYQVLANEETRFETHLCVFKQRKQSERRLDGESIEGAFEIQLEGFDEFEKLQQELMDSRN